MKKDLTELVFVLDMSGSMSNLTDDTIGGFNSVLKQHSSGEGEVLVTTYLFNTKSRMLHDRVPAAKVSPMTEEDYCAGGCTALIDALGLAIRHIASVHKYAREEDIPEHTVFIVTTDGMENASHIFSANKVREMVKHEQEKYGWEFIFLAANIDAAETAENYGINPQRAVNYHNDCEGTAMLYKTVSGALGSIRRGHSLDAEPCWREDADMDFNNRKNKL